ncbi:MAG: hypothetical protein U0528_09455 [Anaerolineae bacterium]
MRLSLLFAGIVLAALWIVYAQFSDKLSLEQASMALISLIPSILFLPGAHQSAFPIHRKETLLFGTLTPYDVWFT